VSVLFFNLGQKQLSAMREKVKRRKLFRKMNLLEEVLTRIELERDIEIIENL